MRVLRFIVDGQVIKPDPSCNFDGLFPGKNNHIQAEFDFSSEWDKRIKVIGFWSMLGNEYPPQILDEYDSCMIPVEALARPTFRIQVLGKYRGATISTNRLTIYQRGGGV